MSCTTPHHTTPHYTTLHYATTPHHTTTPLHTTPHTTPRHTTTLHHTTPHTTPHHTLHHTTTPHIKDTYLMWMSSTTPLTVKGGAVYFSGLASAANLNVTRALVNLASSPKKTLRVFIQRQLSRERSKHRHNLLLRTYETPSEAWGLNESWTRPTFTVG